METQEAELVEDNSKRDNRGRRISDPQRIVELIGAYESSGLTQRQFCRRECINYHTFVAWLGKHRRSGAPDAPGNQSPQLRELVIGEGPAPVAGDMEAVMPDGIRLRSGCPDRLARLIGLLRSSG